MSEQKRDGFVFYRSYYEAIQNLPEKDRLAVYEAIFSYALNDEETETVGVPAAVFMLVKPTLDASKRKAASGKTGGEAKAKQAESKSEAKRKQTASKTEANDKQTVSKAEAIKDEGQEIKDKGQETRDEGQGMNDTTTLSAAQTEAKCPFGRIRQLYHELCPSFPMIRGLDGERKKAVAARWRAYQSIITFKELFSLAEASSFLKGQNDRNWHADFDWLMKANNFAKVLEHKYDDRESIEKAPTGPLGVLAKLYEEAGYDQAGSG